MKRKNNFEPGQPNVDYSFGDGLDITQTTYRDGETSGQADMVTTYRETLIDPISAAEMQARTQRIARSLGSHSLDLCLVKSERPSGELMVVTMGWGGDLDNPIAQRELQYHAAHNPESDIAVVNNPGHGESSPLPRSLSGELARTGSFIAQGELTAETLLPLTSDYDTVSIAGHSYGGRQAIGLAAALDSPIRQLRLFDAPGSRDLGLRGLAKGFMQLEGGHASQYNKQAPDEQSAEIQRLGDSTAMSDIMTLAKNGGLFQQFIDQTRAMSKPSLEKDLLLAAPNVRESIAFTSPDKSELNYPQDVSDIMQRVSYATSAAVIHDVIRRHTHSLTNSNPNMLAYLQRTNR